MRFMGVSGECQVKSQSELDIGGRETCRDLQKVSLYIAFGESSMVQLLNLELADTLGNLLNRCCSKGVNKLDSIPKYPSEYRGDSQLAQDLEYQMNNARELVGDVYDQFNFYQGCVHIMSMLRLANQFVQEQQPRTLKAESDRDKIHWVLSLTFECLRISGILLQPIVPDLSSRLLDKLSVEAGVRPRP